MANKFNFPEQARKGWEAQFRSHPEEYECELNVTEGHVPEGLVGSFFRNGPGLFEIGETKNIHNIDADGMIVRISFREDGKVFFKNKFVRTKGYNEEQAANKVLQKGVFGTIPSGWILKGAFSLPFFKNTANTNQIIWHDGTGGPESNPRLLALWEGGCPYSLDPNSLETYGECDFKGKLKSFDMFTAHPRICPFTNHMIGIAVNPAGRFAKLRTLEFDSACNLVEEHTIKLLRRASSIHSFAITQNYIIIVQDPVEMVYWKFVLGYGVDDFIREDKESDTLIYVIPRKKISQKGKKAYTLYRTKAISCYHHLNAYEEDATGNILMDSCVYDHRPPLDLKDTSTKSNVGGDFYGKLSRFIIENPAISENKVVQVAIHPASPHSIEMPIFHDRNGMKHRFVYAVNTGQELVPIKNTYRKSLPWSGLAKIDLEKEETERWWLPDGCFLGEPVFVPDVRRTAEEDGGYILFLIYDSTNSKSSLAIIDAQRFTEGPICKIDMKSQLPFGFHVSWADSFFGPTFSTVYQNLTISSTTAIKSNL